MPVSKLSRDHKKRLKRKSENKKYENRLISEMVLLGKPISEIAEKVGYQEKYLSIKKGFTQTFVDIMKLSVHSMLAEELRLGNNDVENIVKYLYKEGAVTKSVNRTEIKNLIDDLTNKMNNVSESAE